jgi:phage tail-like protein
MARGAGERPLDPVRVFSFRLEIDGISEGQFRSVSGIETSAEIVEHSDGIDNNIIHKTCGRIKFGDITLEQGEVGSKTLWEKYKETVKGSPKRFSGSIVMCDADGTEVGRVNFFEGWISAWKGFNLVGGEGKSAVQEIKITHERLELA